MKKMICICILMFVSTSFVACSMESTIKLRKEIFIVELGEQISTKIETYVVKDTNKDVLKEAKVSFKESKSYTVDNKSNTLKAKDKDYLPVGKYNGSIKYRDNKKDFIVEIKDTTAPTFVDFKKEIEVEAGTNVNLEDKFKAEDLSKVTIAIKKDTLDLNKEGSYDIEVTATDQYKNKVTEKSTVKVIAKVEEPVVEETQPIDSSQSSTPAQQPSQNQENTNPIGNAVANVAKSYVGNSSFFLGEWSCVNTVEKAINAAGANGDAFVNVYDNFGNGGYQVSDLQIGDIVMYYSTSNIYHCAVYIGNGQAVHGGFHSDGDTNSNTVSVAISSYNAGAGSDVKFYRFW